MSWVETKYINLISHRLDRFKQLGRDLWNFRCPYCGDSHKKKTRRRGYFYDDAGKVKYKCHNCGTVRGFGDFLKENFPENYKPYIFEIFGRPIPSDDAPAAVDNPGAFTTDTANRFKSKRVDILSHFTPMNAVDEDNPGLLYLCGRKIPGRFLQDLYWVEDGAIFSDLLPAYKDRALPGHEAIMIPFLDFDGKVMFVQLRYIGDDVGDLRYMTLEVNGGMKVWGFDRVDLTKPVDILEGSFDAMFMDNAIAAAGADIIEVAKYVKSKGAPSVRLIWDADFSKNQEVRRRLERAVEAGFPVVLFEKGSLSGKDINDAIKNDSTVADIKAAAANRTFDGLQAKLALSQFRKPTEKRTHNVHGTTKKSKASFRF